MLSFVSQGYGYLAQGITQFGSSLNETEAKYWSTVKDAVPQLDVSFELMKKMEEKEVEVFDTELAENLRNFLASPDAPWNGQGMDPPTELILSLTEMIDNGKDFTLAHLVDHKNKSLQWNLDNAKISAEVSLALDTLTTDEKVAKNRVALYQEILSRNGEFSSLYKNELTPLAWSILFGADKDVDFFKAIGVKNTCEVTGEALKFLQSVGRRYVASFRGGQASLARLFVELMAGVRGPLQEQSFSGVVPTEKVRDTTPDNFRLNVDIESYSSAIILNKIMDVVALIGELVTGMDIGGDLRAGLGCIASIYAVPDEPINEMEKKVRETCIKLKPRMYSEYNELLGPDVGAGGELGWLAYFDTATISSGVSAVVSAAFIGFYFYIKYKKEKKDGLDPLRLDFYKAERVLRRAEDKLNDARNSLLESQATGEPERDQRIKRLNVEKAKDVVEVAKERVNQTIGRLKRAKEVKFGDDIDDIIEEFEEEIPRQQGQDASFWFNLFLDLAWIGFGATIAVNTEFDVFPDVQGAITAFVVPVFLPLVVFTSMMAVAGFTFSGLLRWKNLGLAGTTGLLLGAPMILRSLVYSVNYVVDETKRLNATKADLDLGEAIVDDLTDPTRTSERKVAEALTKAAILSRGYIGGFGDGVRGLIFGAAESAVDSVFNVAVDGTSVAADAASRIAELATDFFQGPVYGPLLPPEGLPEPLQGIDTHLNVTQSPFVTPETLSVTPVDDAFVTFALFAGVALLSMFAFHGLSLRGRDNRANSRASNKIFYLASGGAVLAGVAEVVAGFTGNSVNTSSAIINAMSTGNMTVLKDLFNVPLGTEGWRAMQTITQTGGFNRIMATIASDVATPFTGAILLTGVTVAAGVRVYSAWEGDYMQEVLDGMEEDEAGSSTRAYTPVRTMLETITTPRVSNMTQNEALIVLASQDNPQGGSAVRNTFQTLQELDLSNQASSSTTPPTSPRVINVINVTNVINFVREASVEVADMAMNATGTAALAGQAIAARAVDIIQEVRSRSSSPDVQEEDSEGEESLVDPRVFPENDGFYAMLGDPSMPENSEDSGPSQKFEFDFKHDTCTKVEIYIIAKIREATGSTVIREQSGSILGLRTDSDIRRPFVPDEPLSSFDPSRRVTS